MIPEREFKIIMCIFIVFCTAILAEIWRLENENEELKQIVGILLGCDFRDTKEYTKLFFEHIEDLGL